MFKNRVCEMCSAAPLQSWLHLVPSQVCGQYHGMIQACVYLELSVDGCVLATVVQVAIRRVMSLLRELSTFGFHVCGPARVAAVTSFLKNQAFECMQDLKGEQIQSTFVYYCSLFCVQGAPPVREMLGITDVLNEFEIRLLEQA